MMGRAAVFLDRDGVINRNVLDPITGEYGAPLRADDFVPASGALAAMGDLQAAGFLLFLVSNQPNHAKGKSGMEELAAIHQRLLDALQAAGVTLTEGYYCFHHPKGVVAAYSGPCECRKPSAFFLQKASEDYRVELSHSWMIGDRVSDIECGRRAGVRTIRVMEDHPAKRAAGEIAADFEARDLVEATSIILTSPRSPERPKPLQPAASDSVLLVR